MAMTIQEILDEVDKWNKIGAEAGRQIREEHFRQGLPVVIEVAGVTMYEYPDGTLKTVAEYDAEEQRTTGRGGNVWKTPEELRSKLDTRIAAVIGDGPRRAKQHKTELRPATP
jgi:hypothetical protein